MLRRSLKKATFKAFRFLDRFGLHLLPKHYYTPIPDYTWLSHNQDTWTNRVPIEGIHWDLDEQVHWLKDVCGKYYEEVHGLALYHELVDKSFGPGYGPIESQVLYCFIRSMSPKRILEIGSGLSTAISSRAGEKNAAEGRVRPSITCIEPYPYSALQHLEGVRIIQTFCQKVPLETYDVLEAGDLLFIDSSHAVKLGSDVNKIFLEIVPRLKQGVFVHVHDIYLPYLYHRDPLGDYLAPQETALLLALLINNPTLQVTTCLSALHYDRTSELQQIAKDYRPQTNVKGMANVPDQGRHFPSSLWMQTTTSS